jgi:hypothetical protein
MDARFCALCRPATPQPIRASAGHRQRLSPPTETETRVALGRVLGQREYSYVVVSTQRGNREAPDSSFADISSRTEKVHLAGFPFLWAVEEILRRAPNLKVLQVVPTMMRHVPESSRHLATLKAHGVKIVTGYDRPEVAWATNNECRDPRYRRLRQMLLRPENRAQLDELCELGFEMAHYARRYFCLDNEEYVPYRILSAERGIHVRQDHAVSAYINGIIHVLDPTYQVNIRSASFARSLVKRADQARELRKNGAEMQALLERLGVSAWPQGLPLARADIYERVLKAWRADGLGALEDRERFVIVCRFGLDGHSVRTLLELGNAMSQTRHPDHALSRERVRQIEAEALFRLGIDEFS